MSENFEFEPQFIYDDETVKQADGEYQFAYEIMERDKEPKPWCLFCRMTVFHIAGQCGFGLELYDDGTIKIIDFTPSDPDPLANFDVRCLRAWADAKGWATPVPSKYVIDDRVAFWKHQWMVELVDSPDLERRYGAREQFGSETGREDEPLE